MKVSGLVTKIDTSEKQRAIRIDLKDAAKPIWVPPELHPQIRDLKEGVEESFEVADTMRWYYVFRGWERAVSQTAGPQTEQQPDAKQVPSPAEQPPKPTEGFNIPYSHGRIGELYPILVDPEGNIVDGLHRLAVKKDWRKEVLPWVRSRKDFLVARIHANLHRRTVPKEERQKDFTELANILVNEGEVKGKLAEKISELTGFSEKYVLELLPKSLKLSSKVAAGKASAEERSVRLSRTQGVTQPETLPDAKVDIEKESERIGQVFTSAPDQDISDIYTGSCPACGAKIRWDEERKIFVKPAD